MYSIRLELGREAEDYRFREYQKEVAKQEELEYRNRKKQAWYIKRISYACVHLLLLVMCILMARADYRIYRENQELEAEIANRPVYSVPNIAVDKTVLEEIEEKRIEKEEEEQKRYTAQKTDATVGISQDVISEYAIVVDINSNTILAARSMKERISPASMTKILTVLVAAEHLDESDLDKTFTITPEITYYAYKHDCSSVGFSDDEAVTVRDLLYGTIMPSGADAALGLATYIAGGQDEFVELMNDKLEELGLSETTHMTNCIGLYDENHYSTCYDMAMILHAAIDNPLAKEILSKHIYTTTATEQHPDGIEISNLFLRRIEDKPVGGDVICAKTGYVSESGNCSASYATDGDGTDLIVVTGKSSSAWRCIYDHVDLYRKYFPHYDESMANDVAEKAEMESETDN